MRAILSAAIALIATTSLAQQAPDNAQPKAADDAAFVNGALAVPGAEPDGQTVPAKYSERNAKIDATPTMAYPLALTREQRQRIFETVMKSDAPVSTVDAKPAQELPGTTELRELPPELVASMPAAQGMSYIKLADKVLLVRAPTMTVMDEVGR